MTAQATTERVDGLRCGDVTVDHATLREQAAKVAAGLVEHGVGPGDRVALIMRNSVRFAQITLGAAHIGAVSVPVNWHWKADEIGYVLRDSGARLVFADEDLCDMVAEVAPDGVPVVSAGHNGDGLQAWLVENDPWSGERPTTPPTTMIYTSGTTGRPKGVVREPTDPTRVKDRVALVLGAFGLERGMRTLIPAPLYHTAPHMQLVFALQAGFDVTVMQRFDAEELLRTVQLQRIEHIQAVPTMFVRMLQLPEGVRSRYDLSSLRTIVHAAAACPDHIKRAMIDWVGPIVREYYGGTEIGAVVGCNTQEWLDHPGTVGRPIQDTEISIIDDGGHVLPAGSVGQVFIKPPTCQPAFRYHDQADATAAVARDGYVTLGDVGYVDADGFLYITDRVSDMVISGGVNIYPAEIEGCLMRLDGVADAAVFGIPDPDFGEALVAHVQPRPGAALTEEQVREHVRASLAGYKVPRSVVFDPNLPRDDSGKLVKRRLRERYARSNA